MLWFENNRIPDGKWPFLHTTYNYLEELELQLPDHIDLTEGFGSILVTGCLNAYRQAMLRRILDLSQATIASWNAEQIFGSVVCARALLETLATFYSLLIKAESLANKKNWKAIERLVNGYAFSTSSSSRKGNQRPEMPSNIRSMVKSFIHHTDPGKEKFWDQICEIAHPNGKVTLEFAGILRNRRFDSPSPEINEKKVFPAIYNCLYSCCWLSDGMLRFDILCEHIRTGESLGDDHPLIQEKKFLDTLVHNLAEEIGEI